MNDRTLIIGAGMAGVSAAYYLAVRHGATNVTLIDERDPLTLTSDKGTQGYRNWWPGPDNTMLQFISRSIDLMEEAANETNNTFRLNRRGYLFATATDAGVNELKTTAARVSSFGMGSVREHTTSSTYQPARAEGYQNQPDGADLLLGSAAHAAFPFLSPATQGALHVRRAGWMNAPAMGAWMLRKAIGAGVTFLRERVTSIDTSGGRVRGVKLASGGQVSADRVVIAAGPKLHELQGTLDLDLPLIHELHAKVTFNDTQHIIPRWAPFTIWNDPVELEGKQFPAGIHVRPIDGPRGDETFLIWMYHTEPCTPSWPPSFDANYARTCVHGLADMVPRMRVYANSGNYGITDGGYYCKVPDNRPLIGPLPVEGAYIAGALSGTGIMSAHAVGELIALHVTEKKLPGYATAFLPTRFDDPAYLQQVEAWGRMTGQL